MSEITPLVKTVVVRSQRDFYVQHLRIVNAVLPKAMTEKELEILAEFLSLTGDIASVRFGTTGKAIIRKNCDISHSGLSNHLKELKNKMIISSTKKDAVINKHIFPVTDELQTYSLKLVYRQDG